LLHAQVGDADALLLQILQERLVGRTLEVGKLIADAAARVDLQEARA
jgi:hypothetical protein